MTLLNVVNNFNSILLTFACLFLFEVIPTSKIYSCGSNKSCCKMMTKKGCKQKCCCLKNLHKNRNDKKHKDCGGSCNGKGCPCSQSSSSVQFENISTKLDLDLLANYYLGTISWYYIQKNPSPGFLFIWLKPKISNSIIC